MNWYKVGGIALIVLGVLVILGSNAVLVIVPADGHPYPVADVSGFYIGVTLGVVLVIAGVLLYYVGVRKEKRAAHAPESPRG